MRVLLIVNVRDEVKLNEWIQHHLRLGFDGIYITDHLSINPVTSSDERIFVVRYEKQNVRKTCLMHNGIKFAKKNSFDYAMSLDADEFLYLKNHDTIQEYIEFINTRGDFSQIGINWLLFGTNGLNNISEEIDDSIIKSYTRSQNELDKHLKSIVKVEGVHGVNNPHFFLTNGKMCNSEGIKINMLAVCKPVRKYQSASAFVAHYIHQSYETYYNRKVRYARDDIPGKFRDEIPREKLHKLHNDVENMLMVQRYAVPVTETPVTETPVTETPVTETPENNIVN